MRNFRPVDRKTGFLLPPSVDEWLPERHLARFVVEIIEKLNLSVMVNAYRGSGLAAYHPRMLLGILVYGYVTGIFSSRKLERATYDSIAFRFIAANDHPDHDTIAAFRSRFAEHIEDLFVQVLMLARVAGVLKVGMVALDGTKIHANASRHHALSYGRICKIEAQLKTEVAELLLLAEQADAVDEQGGMSVPEELSRREDRAQRIVESQAKMEAHAKARHNQYRAKYEAKLNAKLAEQTDAVDEQGGMSVPEELSRRKDRVECINESTATVEMRAEACHERKQAKYETKLNAKLAEQTDAVDEQDGMSVPEELSRRLDQLQGIVKIKKKIEVRTKVRDERKQAKYETKLNAREEKVRKSGRKLSGRPLQSPKLGPVAKDQINLTDPDSRIMPVSGGSFIQGYNAQILAVTGSLLVLINHVAEATNDKQQIEPALEKLKHLPGVLRKVKILLADNGYFSKANVEACVEAGITPLIALGRERHQPWDQHFATLLSCPQDPTALEEMAYQLATPEGRKAYAKRKHTPEPVFGIIKEVMGFRRFHLRGLDKVQGEWNLVTMAWNIKRMYNLQSG